MGRILLYLIFAFALYASWQRLSGHSAEADQPAPVSSALTQQLQQPFTEVARSSALVQQATAVSTTANNARFHCDGRQYCSQMRSRAEAEYFNQHCPNTKMDGDHDGIPCERDSRW